MNPTDNADFINAISVGSPMNLLLSTIVLLHSIPTMNVCLSCKSSSGDIVFPSAVFKTPSSRNISCPFEYILRTVISPFVSVPVLSAQMYVTDPNVSADANLLITAFFLAKSLAPNANVIVTTAGNASGTADMAKATAAIKTIKTACGENP